MSGSMHSKIRPRLIQYLSSPKRKTEMNQQWIARRSTSDRRKSFWREAAILLVVKTLFEKDKRRFLNFFRSRTSRGRKFKLKSPRFYKSKFATIFRKHSFSVMAIFFLSMTKGEVQMSSSGWWSQFGKHHSRILLGYPHLSWTIVKQFCRWDKTHTSKVSETEAIIPLWPLNFLVQAKPVTKMN